MSRSRLIGPRSFYKEAFAIALPVIAQQLVMSLASLVDNFMVGGLGDVKMAAVNVANQINFVYFVVLWTTCSAAGIFMSQYFGAKDEDGMKQAFRFKLIASVALSSAYLALTLACPEVLIGLMTAGNSERDAIIAEGAVYLRIVSATWIPIAISTSIGTAFREIGLTKQTLPVSLAATAVNTALNWLLIYGNLGAPRLEVAGAALATVVARSLELILMLAVLRAKRPPFAVSPRSIGRIDPKVALAIVSRSWLMLVSETTWVMTETVTTALYNGRGGAEVVAGMAAGWAVANVFFLVFPGIHTTVGVCVGSALGADRLDEAREKARWLTTGAFALGLFVSLGMVAVQPLVPVVFASLTPVALAVTRGLLFAIALYMPMWTLLNAQFAVARSGGDAKMGAIIDVGINVALFIPGAFALALLTPIGPVAMFLILKSTDFLKAFVAKTWLSREIWLRNLTRESGAA